MNPSQLSTLLSQWSELEPKVIYSTELIDGFWGTHSDFDDFIMDPEREHDCRALEKFLQTHITQSGYSLKIHSYSENRHSVFIGEAVSEQNRESLLEALLMCWIRFLKWERRG